MSKPRILALAIGSAGLACAGLGLAAGGAARWLLGWTALACLLVGGAYALNRPDLFGKSRGRLPLPRVLLLLPYLTAFWTASALIRWWRRLPATTEVAPGLHVGGRIREGDLPSRLHLVLDLTAEFSEPAAVRERPGYRCLPVLDGSTPADLEDFLTIVREAAEGPGGVLIHCESGVGRAPTAAAAVLVARGVVADAESAIELIAKSRPISPTGADRRFLRRAVARLDLVDPRRS